MICSPFFAVEPYLDQDTLSIVTDVGGTGKSRIVEAIIEQTEGRYGKGSVKILASSGCAAAPLGGTTLHEGIGIRLGAKELPNWIVTPSAATVRSWVGVKVVIEDEVSLLEPVVFTLLEELLRRKKENPRPFGGVHVVSFRPAQTPFCRKIFPVLERH
ncbi:hypothetical protein DFS34DRAFT_576252 [Phlyctochytrium arcticum]|nr:hypothetical protein DFS34DRAFT_576252 [Phlyctochytrium arcticum]